MQSLSTSYVRTFLFEVSLNTVTIPKFRTEYNLIHSQLNEAVVQLVCHKNPAFITSKPDNTIRKLSPFARGSFQSLREGQRGGKKTAFKSRRVDGPN